MVAKIAIALLGGGFFFWLFVWQGWIVQAGLWGLPSGLRRAIWRCLADPEAREIARSFLEEPLNWRRGRPLVPMYNPDGDGWWYDDRGNYYVTHWTGLSIWIANQEYAIRYTGPFAGRPNRYGNHPCTLGGNPSQKLIWHAYRHWLRENHTSYVPAGVFVTPDGRPRVTAAEASRRAAQSVSSDLQQMMVPFQTNRNPIAPAAENNTNLDNGSTPVYIGKSRRRAIDL